MPLKERLQNQENRCFWRHLGAFDDTLLSTNFMFQDDRKNHSERVKKGSETVRVEEPPRKGGGNGENWGETEKMSEKLKFRIRAAFCPVRCQTPTPCQIFGGKNVGKIFKNSCTRPHARSHPRTHTRAFIYIDSCAFLCTV